MHDGVGGGGAGQFDEKIRTTYERSAQKIGFVTMEI